MPHHSLPRVAALVGPHLSGKSTLLEAMLAAAEDRPIAEQRGERPSTLDPQLAQTTYLGDSWTFIDCPGSIELLQLSFDALKIADIAVLVCEPTAQKVLTLAPYLHFLDEHHIPHVIFINKIETASEPVGDILEALRKVSDRPLVLRELPFRENGEIAGFVDLISEKAWHFRHGARSERVKLPKAVKSEEAGARTELVETLAEFDDDLLEKFLEDIMPPTEELHSKLAHEVEDDLVAPVFLGSADRGHGITRLLKSLRHDAPGPKHTAERLGLEPTDGVQARVWRTSFEPFIGKMSTCRVFAGELKQGDEVQVAEETVRLGTVHAPFGKHVRLNSVGVGEVAAISRTEELHTGHLIGSFDDDRSLWLDPLEPVFGQVLSAKKQKDEVKLGTALHQLIESDPSLVLAYDHDEHEVVLRGQGELHLRKATALLASQYHVEVTAAPPHVPYRETVRQEAQVHYRYRRQTGGHGQFADIHLTVGPNERGAGLAFSSSVVGGAVPKRFIPAVEKGVVEFMQRGPLGFPVVDLKVELTDGKFHAVDSSDMAFKTAAILAMRDALALCESVLLEPIYTVTVDIPTEFSSPVGKVVMGHRGQLLAFEQRPGWHGWDRMVAHLPEADMANLILELRALTQSVGTYHAEFDHMAELSGRAAEQVVAARKG